MIIGYFDYLIFGILIFLNIKFWKAKIDWKAAFLILGLFFGIGLPIISIIIELEIVKATSGEWMDSFEVVYTILRFPTYWIIGIIQLIVLGFKWNYQNNRFKKTDKLTKN